MIIEKVKKINNSEGEFINHYLVNDKYMFQKTKQIETIKRFYYG